MFLRIFCIGFMGLAFLVPCSPSVAAQTLQGGMAARLFSTVEINLIGEEHNLCAEEEYPVSCEVFREGLNDPTRYQGRNLNPEDLAPEAGGEPQFEYDVFTASFE